MFLSLCVQKLQYAELKMVVRVLHTTHWEHVQSMILKETIFNIKASRLQTHELKPASTCAEALYIGTHMISSHRIGTPKSTRALQAHLLGTSIPNPIASMDWPTYGQLDMLHL